MYHPEKPYNDLPLVPPTLTFSEAVYRKTISANKALAELKGLAGTIPNQTIILNSLILKEAKDSSEIENIVTTQDELYRAFTSDQAPINPAVKEVMNYKEALWGGFSRLNRRGFISVGDIGIIQEVLIGNDAGLRKQPGTALKNDRTGKTIYTPPQGIDVIQDKLRNLEEYVNAEDEHTDPLIKMAIIHYQFESIHPYYDGNGRTGRILNVLYLIQQKLLDLPILYMSSYIIKNKQKYYKGLDQVRTINKWEDWIIYILDSVEQTAKDTITVIREIKASLQSSIGKAKIEAPKIYSKELIEALYFQPYSRIPNLEAALGISRFTASKYLKELEKIGFLKGERAGREMIYINLPLFEVLKTA